jgi:hypothetical protein
MNNWGFYGFIGYSQIITTSNYNTQNKFFSICLLVITW